MSKSQRKKLSPANLEIMKIVWDRDEVTINDVVEAINAKREDKVRRTTIQVQMRRLEEYGWLSHTRKGRTFYYKASAGQDPTRSEILEDIVHRVFHGSRADLVKCLFDDEEISIRELDELRRLLDEAGGES